MEKEKTKKKSKKTKTKKVSKTRIFPDFTNNENLIYPYVSKIKVNYSKYNPEIQNLYQDNILIPDNNEEEYLQDIRLKPLKKYYRPEFSPHMNSCIIDIVFFKKPKRYMFIINENTRYLVVYTLPDKSGCEIYECLDKFINEFTKETKQIYIKGDGERGFGKVQRLFNDRPNVHFYLKPTRNQYGLMLTNSNKIIDIVVKTIRNLLGRVSQYNPNALINDGLLSNVVNIYNNTVHSAFNNKFTPAQVQNDYLLEAEYIRWCEYKLKEAEDKQLKSGLLTYEIGNILLVHLPLEKTTFSMSQKRRRNFDELAIFRGYKNGNAICELLNPYPNLQVVVLPIYYTKIIANDINDYRRKFGNQFVIKD
jgi:hypothetical protein